MIVVAVIGVLASVAAPSMQLFLVKARSAEIQVVRNGISIAARDAFMRADYKWPTDDGTGNWADGTPVNPTLDMTDLGTGNGDCRIGPPKTWETSADQDLWKFIDFVPEGQLRGRYKFTPDRNGAFDDPYCYQVLAISDLDADGTCAGRNQTWYITNNANWALRHDIVFGVGAAILDESEW